MTREQFRAIYPQLIDWIEQTLVDYSTKTQSVVSLRFRRLPQYFSKEFLASAKVVPVENVPMPPLSKFGATDFDAFEQMEAAGITYLDTFFVNQLYATDESLHFHELVHVVQWSLLGPERFLAAYADGLEHFGYRNSPLETMAYDAQAWFEDNPAPFNAEQSVQNQLQHLNLI